MPQAAPRCASRGCWKGISSAIGSIWRFYCRNDYSSKAASCRRTGARGCRRRPHGPAPCACRPNGGPAPAPLRPYASPKLQRRRLDQPDQRVNEPAAPGLADHLQPSIERRPAHWETRSLPPQRSSHDETGCPNAVHATRKWLTINGNTPCDVASAISNKAARMIRLLPCPGLLTGVVVATSLASGVAFGAAAVSAALALRMIVRSTRG